ncbi:hypothetical protein TNIN_244801 [Trichonephila inaurata madagascariensis]|uniref:Uncharacterized protein n=1 Tax=Trichonephila inaurata madagascariensis TaxID=2747483 RepID=A0A8X6Y5B9_9ARAC|nr:hypothetical protein TNIN_244801 [Trichonephila inaurata madagascariensis]
MFLRQGAKWHDAFGPEPRFRNKSEDREKRFRLPPPGYQETYSCGRCHKMSGGGFSLKDILCMRSIVLNMKENRAKCENPIPFPLSSQNLEEIIIILRPLTSRSLPPPFHPIFPEFAAAIDWAQDLIQFMNTYPPCFIGGQASRVIIR